MRKKKISDHERLMLNVAKKVSRETNIMPKPMITTDKKKKASKNACRTKINDFE
jgi:hypothetical protein